MTNRSVTASTPKPKARRVKASPPKPGTLASGILSQVARNFSELLSQTLDEQLTSIVLFGSVARGEATKKSDIDVLVVVKAPTDADLIALREQVTELCLDFEAGPEVSALALRGFAVAIRPIVYPETEALRTHLFYLDLAVDGQILYDPDQFIVTKLAQVRQRMLELGTRREYLTHKRWVWLLKPGMSPGERVEL
jgi:hypothetical protein